MCLGKLHFKDFGPFLKVAEISDIYERFVAKLMTILDSVDVGHWSTRLKYTNIRVSKNAQGITTGDLTGPIVVGTLGAGELGGVV